MIKQLSQSEKVYIMDGCNANVREDGRSHNDFRSVRVENHILPHAHGSSRIKIGHNTDLLCCIKLDITEPIPSNPKQGIIEFNIEVSPSCNIRDDDKAVSDHTSLLASQLERLYLSSSALDLESLLIIEGKFCWIVYIDITVLQCDSHVLQVSSLAAYVALQCCLIPKVNLIPNESGALTDFDIDGDLRNSSQFDMRNVPIYMIACQVGNSVILDASSSELACASCVYCVPYTQDGRCLGFSKNETGSFDFNKVPFILQICEGAASSLFSYLNSYYQASKSLEEGSLLDTQPIRKSFLGF